MKFCWHKWQRLKLEASGKFLDEDITWFYVKFRTCLKCNKSQELNFSGAGFSWQTLGDSSTEVLLRKYKKEIEYAKR